MSAGALGWEVTGRTRVWVHLAHPSAHVRAPQTFNLAFRQRSIDAVAVSIDVAPTDLPALVRGLKGWRNLGGIGVTMPHKGPIADLCDEVVGIARLVGTVNAVRREADGRLVGANTDGSGFVTGLTRAGHAPRGKRVLVVGIGGAGTAIAFSLAQAGAREITLANRTPEKAETIAARIAEAFPGVVARAGAADPAGFDIVVNATSLGMGAADALPLDVSRLAAETVVAEIVMRPERTRLVEEAEQRGCQVHLGLPMLTCQIQEVITFLDLDQGGSP